MFKNWIPKDTLEVELPIKRDDFIESFHHNVLIGEINTMSDFFEPFTSTKKELKGNISGNEFTIKRLRRLFSPNQGLAIAKGRFKENINGLSISMELTAFRGAMRFMHYMLFGLYAMGIVFMLVLSAKDDSLRLSLIALPFIIFHALIFLVLFRFMMGRSVKKLKYELEREFHYFTKTSD